VSDYPIGRLMEGAGMSASRRVFAGEEYSADEDVVLDTPEEQWPAPPVETQGEPWGWTKRGPKPRGWRKDGRYGPD
jgi:hypothetical protein